MTGIWGPKGYHHSGYGEPGSNGCGALFHFPKNYRTGFSRYDVAQYYPKEISPLSFFGSAKALPKNSMLSAILSPTAR